ncbi:hypothetical protein BDF20DRAFT_894634 [Mycotypha africana]|uniref:uncharacterized protein n=1 Tax=Mycotypha africana TaxID=64632 RepID=UPI0023004BC4|nr:uncharacterized protein BDF20DRAFT_894634 [Mycotypha africana]KAI8969349.1 hypothetical protein BDF20DRAFT_894634 [Mycotypha africana]
MRNVCVIELLKPILTTPAKHTAIHITTSLLKTGSTSSTKRRIIPFVQAFRHYGAAAAAIVAAHSSSNSFLLSKQQSTKNCQQIHSTDVVLDTKTARTAIIPYSLCKSPVRPARVSIAINKLSRQGRSKEALSLFIELIQKSNGREFPSHEALYSLAHALYKSQDLHSLLLIHDTLLQRFFPLPSDGHEQQQHLHHSKSHHFNDTDLQQLHNFLLKRQSVCCSKKEAKATLYIYTMIFNLLAQKTNPPLYLIRTLCYELSLLPINEPTTPYYNTLIDLLLQYHHRKQAFAVYHELIKRSKPSIVTYTILMNDAAKRGQHGKVIEYLDQIEKYHLKLDYGITSVVVKSLCQTGEFTLAKAVVLQLERQRHFYQQLQQRQYQKKNDQQDLLSTKSVKQHLLKLIEKRKRRWEKKHLLRLQALPAVSTKAQIKEIEKQ